LLASDRVIDTPPDGLIDSDSVQLSKAATEAKPHG
jgi:hypothetical protein